MTGFAGLAGVLQHVLLPLLEVKDFAALACVNKDLKQLVYGQPAWVWEAAARRVQTLL